MAVTFLKDLFNLADDVFVIGIFVYFALQYRAFMIALALTMLYANYHYFGIGGTMKLLISYVLFVLVLRVGYVSTRRTIRVFNVYVRKQKDTTKVRKSPLFNVMGVVGMVASGYALV